MQVVIDTYAAVSILDHCYRVQALQGDTENRSAICGVLLGSRHDNMITITDFVPGHNEDNIKHVRNFTKAGGLPLGWYSLSGLKADEVKKTFKRATSTLLLTVQLPSKENNYAQQISAVDLCWSDDSSTAPVTHEAEVTIQHESPITNIIMASVMSAVFPDVAEEINNHHRLSIETHTVVADPEIEASSAVKSLPSDVSIEAVTKSLSEISSLPTAKTTPKALADEIRELQEKIRQTLKDVQDANDEEEGVAGSSLNVGAAFGEDRLKETMLVKCLAAKVNQRLAACRKQFSYQVNRKDHTQTGSSYRGRGGASYGGGASSGYVARGGRGGVRGGRGGRGGSF